MPKEENTKSVAQLIYEFYYFYVYEFDPQNMVINIKDGSECVQSRGFANTPGRNTAPVFQDGAPRPGFSKKF